MATEQEAFVCCLAVALWLHQQLCARDYPDSEAGLSALEPRVMCVHNQ